MKMAQRKRRKVRILSMSKKIKTLLVTAVAVMCVMFTSVTPAFAFVDPTWEESAEETTAEETVIEETPVEESPVEEAEPETEQAFSTPGNGDLGDEITSGMKDFYTIHTKNNNTFYLVVDHAGSQDNVYMLSLIDENDLSEFLEETVKQTEPETQSQVVVVPETTPEPETETTVTPEPEQKQENHSSLMTLIIFAVIGVGAAAYYFKIYKPKKQADEYESEGMETGDGLDTENEDENE